MPKETGRAPLLQDFDSFRQALNVAAADQRVLVILQGAEDELERAKETLRPIAWSGGIIGRFHYDCSPEPNWTSTISGLEDSPGIHLVQPGQFGTEGVLYQSLPLDARLRKFAQSCPVPTVTMPRTPNRRSTPPTLLRAGKNGIYFAGAVPYGEDRDADGEIDTARTKTGAPLVNNQRKISIRYPLCSGSFAGS